MTEHEYRSQVAAFLTEHIEQARRTIRLGLTDDEQADYIHMRIEADYIRSGIPFYVFHVTAASAEFESAPRPESGESEFQLPEHLMPDLWEEEPEDRYTIVSECILNWIEDAFSGVVTDKPCYAAEAGNYRVYDLRTKQWCEMDTWH